jgi:hypothetical protein
MANQEPFSFNGRGRAQEQTPHSNVHHDEKPLKEFDNTPLAEAPLTYDPRTHEGDLTTEQLPEGFQSQPTKKERLTKSQKIGAAIANSGGDSRKAEPQPPTASAPANLNFTPSVDYYMDTGDPSYPEVKQPLHLTADQISSWNSGDISTQNDVAYETIAPRLQAAIQEAYDGTQQGADVDLSWLSTDSTVQSEVMRIVNDFMSVTPNNHNGDWFGFEVCRNFDYDKLARCSVQNLVDQKVPNLVDGAIAVVYSDANDPGGRDEEHGRGYQLNMRVELEGDTLVLTSK